MERHCGASRSDHGRYLWDPHAAQIARLRLAHERIPAFLEKEFTAQAAWHLANAIGGIRLVVPEDRLEEAQRLLTAKVPFEAWCETRCWDLRVSGEAISHEEPNAAARERRFNRPLSPREELADRALRATVLGTIWLTPVAFAVVDLVNYHLARGRCGLAYRRKAQVARWMLVVILAAIIAMVAAALAGPQLPYYEYDSRSETYLPPFQVHGD